MKKKKNKRSNAKYPALKPELNLKTRYDSIDYDYLDQLSEKEKDWLNRFTEEYTNANFNHKGKKILNEEKNPEPMKVEILENAGPNHDITVVNKTKNSYKKQSYDRNNSRNRDILTRVKASGKLKDTDTIREKDIMVMSPEDHLILKEEINERLNLVKKRQNRKNNES